MPNKVVLFAAIAAGTFTALRFVPAPNHGVRRKSVMEDLLYKVILGWPSAVLGLFFLTVGASHRRVSLSIFGAIAATGFCLFVSLYVIPYTLLLLLVIASNWASVIYLSKGRRRLAVALISPLAIENLALGYVVYAQ